MATVKEIQNAYNDNADYFATNDLAKCKLFITACVRIIGLPSRAAEKGQGTSAEHEFDVPTIREELQYARTWLSQNATANESHAGGIEVTDVDFRPGACRR